MTGNFLEEGDGIRAPPPKSFHHEGLEVNALSSTVRKVGAVFAGFPGVDGCAWTDSGLKEDGFLSGGSDADVERHFPAINPMFHVNVGGVGERSRNKPWHFLLRVHGGGLGFSEDFVPESVVATPFKAVVVMAVEGVVAQRILDDVAGVGAALLFQKERDTETVAHGGAEGAGIQVEIEVRGGEGIEPVAGVR